VRYRRARRQVQLAVDDLGHHVLGGIEHFLIRRRPPLDHIDH